MLAATMQELQEPLAKNVGSGDEKARSRPRDSSLTSLSSRPPELRLGMGLPMSRVYAEYWAGGLELHSLEGYGVDAFLQISKLGNQNEQLTSRASIDAVWTWKAVTKVEVTVGTTYNFHLDASNISSADILQFTTTHWMLSSIAGISCIPDEQWPRGARYLWLYQASIELAFDRSSTSDACPTISAYLQQDHL
jgi:hypothetical protein